MPLQATSGAASYDAFGGGVAVVPNYIEDIFSTTLYTGNGSTQTINNGIDLAGKGGLTWFKRRNASGSHYLFDTARGNNFALSTNETFGQGGGYSAAFNFASTGFTLAGDEGFNTSAATYASWTFREQPKFFDVVTYTGTGTASQTVSHNLGSAPGCIIIKRTDSTSNWFVGHNYDANRLLYLNTTAAATTLGWNSWIFDPTTFRTPSISGSPDVNVSGATYVAYLFAHNAGGFGLTGTDNVISCGSFTTDGSGNATVSLGYEPQWVLIKNATSGGTNWILADNMRGWTTNGTVALLGPDRSNAEVSVANFVNLNATGFSAGANLGASATFIYIAIRRGPMRTPTTGTEVFAPVAYTGLGGSPQTLITNFPIDTAIIDWRSGGSSYNDNDMFSRLSGELTNTISTGTSSSFSANAGMDSNEGFNLKATPWNGSEQLRVLWAMRRAPQVHSQVCYTGNGVTTGRALDHDLTIAPEMIIIVPRNVSGSKQMFWQPLGTNFYLTLNGNQAANGPRTDFWGAMSATTFTLMGQVNSSGTNYQAFLWASCPGISKIGSYTGNGSSQNINCGFTSGARFVMIRRTDVGSNQGVTTSNFYVWDTARGIVSAGDPRLILNSPEDGIFQEQSDDSIDPLSSGFAVNQISATNINVSGGNYVYLAYA